MVGAWTKNSNLKSIDPLRIFNIVYKTYFYVLTECKKVNSLRIVKKIYFYIK